jgi:alpha-L-arabinofuranosidase
MKSWKRLSRLALFALVFLTVGPFRIFAAELIIQADRPGVTVCPELYGVFFEDINRAGDGGIYAEKIQNRSFEDHPTPIAWTPLESPGASVGFTLDKTLPLNADNPTSLKIHIEKTGSGRVGLFNQGFKGITAGKSMDASPAWITKFETAQRGTTHGIAVQAGKEYSGSLYVRQQGFRGRLTISLESRNGEILAKQSLGEISEEWKKFEFVLMPEKSETDARLVIFTTDTGTLWLDMVSLFPKETYKNRPNGLRPDLVKMMETLRPGIFRFPGGSFSEGHILADAWKWKETLGDVATRPGSWNIWGYRSTNGLGFHEYLQLAEDLGAAPLFVAHVGMSEKDFVSIGQLDPWVQDLLDAIEYANGPVSSKWGALRAQNGHPAPFHLKYVEIGNENGMGYSWGGGNRADYLPRYKAFYDRLKATHPEIVTIANIHTEPDVPADVVDEHYYKSSDWFFKAATLYDNYDRKKPKIYVGEYACFNDAGRGNLRAALSEAAFMTGLERNADVVSMSSYAPLFTNPQWEKWKPSAAVFDNLSVYGTPSYYVQAMFASNRSDVILPVASPATSGTSPPLFAVAGLKKDSGDLILKVVNRSSAPEMLEIRLEGLQTGFSGGICTELTSASLEDENSFNDAEKICPKTTPLPAFNEKYNRTFPPFSVSVLRWNVK